MTDGRRACPLADWAEDDFKMRMHGIGTVDAACTTAMRVFMESDDLSVLRPIGHHAAIGPLLTCGISFEPPSASLASFVKPVASMPYRR